MNEKLSKRKGKERKGKEKKEMKRKEKVSKKLPKLFESFVSQKLESSCIEWISNYYFFLKKKWN